MKSIYLRTHRQAYVWMDEWVDLSDKDLIDLEEEIHSHLNNTLSRGDGPKLSGVPPMPDPSPLSRPSHPHDKTEDAAASSSAAKLEHPKKSERENMTPPTRHLKSRLREMGQKLRAKL